MDNINKYNKIIKKNPLLEWCTKYFMPNLNLDEDYIHRTYNENHHLGFSMNKKLCEMLDMGYEKIIDIYIEDEKNCYGDYCGYLHHPDVFSKMTVSTSLLSDENLNAIKEFSNKFIFEVGGGSGYNSYLLEQLDINVYCTDCPGNMFPYHFVDVECTEIDENKVLNIIKNNGAILYIWPIGEYHRLAEWIKLGGTKVIVIGDYRQLWNMKGEKLNNTVCPIFPPIASKDEYLEWYLAKTIEVPHQLPENEDKLYLWELK